MFLNNGPGAFALGEDDRALGVAEVKALLRVTTAGEDATIGRLVDTALGLAEAFLGRLQIARGVRERVTGCGWTALGAAPVSAITAIADASGAALPAAAYAVDIDARGTGWVRSSIAGPLTLDYTAGGAAGWGELIAPIRSGIVLLAGHLYHTGGDATPPPTAVTALWRPFRDLALAARAW